MSVITTADEHIYMLLLLVALFIISNAIYNLLAWFIGWLRLQMVFLCVSHYNLKVYRWVFFYVSTLDEWKRLQHGLDYLEIRRKFKG